MAATTRELIRREGELAQLVELLDARTRGELARLGVAVER